MMNEDLLFFVEDNQKSVESNNTGTWKVLIVDDDAEVHSITKMVLSDFVFKKKSIEFVSAYSGKEAIKIITDIPDIALIFLDVVMEADDSGLKVVQYIREELENFFVRIVLRTGQPGQAPEERVISDYDINDYKEKTELTARKLFTTTMASLRSYSDLMKIDCNRKGLEKIINSSNDISKFKSMNDFISGVLIQLTSILGLDNNSFYCQLSSFAASKDENDFCILSATGKFERYLNHVVHEIKEKDVLIDIDDTIAHHKSEYFQDHIILYFKTKSNSEHLIYIENIEKMDIFDKELVEIFISNVAIAYDNIYLNKESEDTQREIIFALGELTEARSKEAGKHVKRVAEYCKLLGKLCGLDAETVEHIYIGSTMHDVGKVAIPDAILNKPGKLTAEEFEIIKLHSSMGYEMLKKSNRPVMQMAATIAWQHHERYDGMGYPKGLKGENIHIAGRIAAVADVFDALGTIRVYKPAWALQDILIYMKQESGGHFDPKLIKVLFDHIEAFMNIRIEHVD